MPATIYNTVIDQYADWDEWLSVSDRATGNAVNLIGYTAKLEAREKPEDSAALFSITHTASATGQIILGTDGSIKWKVKAATTAGLAAPKNIYYDLRLVASDGSVTRVVEGTAAVSPGVTRP